MEVNVKCPSCSSESNFFVVKNRFQGPFRCWKCKSLFTLNAQSGEIKELEPLSQEDFDKQKADREARRKKAKEKA